MKQDTKDTELHISIETKLFWEGLLMGRKCTPQNTDGCFFDYGIKFGPSNWKHMFPGAQGSFQSPINIRSTEASILKISERLIWNHYEDLPLTAQIENNGKTLIIRANYEFNKPTTW
uniref:Alpha-carbonic anhydrase domain-containing protein n=1 Tax=Megaselia scalaris TaxID=36166 RepID=T1GZX0_MEGSC